MMPIQKLSISVIDVIVIDTAASVNASDILSGTGLWIEVRRQAANITNVSSIPMPKDEIVDNKIVWIFKQRKIMFKWNQT